jgi:hypothetical protein
MAKAKFLLYGLTLRPQRALSRMNVRVAAELSLCTSVRSAQVDAYSGDLAFYLHHAIAAGISAKILRYFC